MAVIANLSEYLEAATTFGEPLPCFKDARVAGAAAPATIAGRLHSLWLYDGNPSAGVAPGAVAVPTEATAGGLRQTDPGGGRQKWLTYGGAGPLVAGRLRLNDRLLHISGLDATVIIAQNVGGALTRYTNGLGNQIAVDIYTQIGAGATTITASYTNQAGTNGRTTVATTFGGVAFREQTRRIILPLQAGDYGVQAVASVTVLASTGTAGNFGVSVIHPLGFIEAPTVGAGADVSALGVGQGPIEILTNACLEFDWLANGTTAPQIMADFFTVEW